MSKIINFEIVTPEKTVLKEEILEATIPTLEGEITVLPKHSPLVSVLKTGVLSLKKKDGSLLVVFVSGGFIEVLNDKIMVLADAADRAEELDEALIEEARARAEEAMKNIRREDASEFTELSASLERELAKSRAVKKWRNINNKI
jgi:F-type H+-transporting ATPase subunit epsilon